MLAGVGVFIFSDLQAAPRRAATASGNVTVRRKGLRTTTSLANLQDGDVVSAGATNASLNFSDGSRVNMAAGSSLEITRSGGKNNVLFRALKGRMAARLRPGKSVQTSTALVRVRGTEIHLVVDDDGTTALAVLEGEADFYNNEGQSVVVEAGQESVVHPGSAPSVPVAIQNPGLLLEWTLQIERVVLPRETHLTTLRGPALQAAIVQRRAAVEAAPSDIAAQLALGEALFDARQYKTALPVFQKAQSLDPTRGETNVHLGETLLELGRIGEAEIAFQTAKAALPAQALTGLAELELARDRMSEAQANAESALATAPQNARAQIALGVSLMRQPGKLDEAAAALQKALTLEPKDYLYQAHAWLALVYLAQDDTVAALKEARAAVQQAPDSALAHGNLSLASFFSGNTRQSYTEARRAVELDPNSLAARVVLGQAALARGDIDQAETQATIAVSLDPRRPEARYLLGTVEASRRDWGHATHELSEALRLAPDFLPAAAVLARVYNQTGQTAKAVAVLTPLLDTHRQGDTVRAALGEVYYEQSNYREAEDQYRKALAERPNSALYYAGLSRALLDDNRLSEAIKTGQQAVELAPEVAQYHALLGRAYDFSRVSFQSEREYRTALSLDPENALARAMLALKATDPTTQVDTFSQAFLYDPSIGRQLLRGGIQSEVTPGAGDDGQRSLSVLHRDTAVDGRLNFFGGYGRAYDDGSARVNDDNSASTLRHDTTFELKPQSNLYFNLVRARAGQGLPGLSTSPAGTDTDAHSEFGFNQAELAVRYRLRGNHHLWFGVTHQSLRQQLTNGDQPFTLPFPLPLGTPFPYSGQTFNNEALIPELRADFSLSREIERPRILTLGAAYARLDPTLNTGPLVQINSLDPAVPPVVLPPTTTESHQNFAVAYAQLTGRATDRLSLVAQLRAQSDRNRIIGGTLNEESHLLPSLLVNYQADKRSTLRLLYNERAGTTNLAFAPNETRLTVEPNILFRGSPRTSRVLELDAERYLSGRRFVKVFLFHASAQDVALGADTPVYTFRVNAPLTLGSLSQTGVGLRYEQPVARNLFLQAGVLLNRTRNRTLNQAFDGGEAPYYPKQTASIALNYVSPSGYKATLAANYLGSFFQDRPNLFGLPTLTARPRFGAQTYVSFLVSKEFSVHNELFFGVTNVFDRQGLTFNDVPTVSDAFGTGSRRIFGGMTRRF
ncbi:beta-barrel assembly-enhancing protease [Abditibacteriota bacterium]|nr:beta-barrel assembly-enhancing protease [Abditibacteriota bacterium]